MIIVMRKNATVKETGAVLKKIEELGYKPHISSGEERTIIGVVGDDRRVPMDQVFEPMEGVERTIPVLQPFKLASKEFRPSSTVVKVGNVAIGGDEVVVMAGPCAVESEEQLLAIARIVKEAGAKVLRGGAFKPRTSPYSFQGMGSRGLELLALARKETGLPVVTEVMAASDIELVASFTDIIQVGARNMQNFSLLAELGKCHQPVLLKRGMMNTLEELLMSAEYILSNGNQQVILCERGIRTFEKYTRNTLDITAVPLVKQLSHLPIIVDPSHATGKWDLVSAASRAAVAAGADGLIIEVHPQPDQALSDGPQSLKPERFLSLMKDLQKVAAAIGKKM
ncbi:MAG: 3-deoxy-7-phosphoheptulonate synthase [Armatimonadetes bacterium]|nr:3-deoxy-7-phosphoheptulonate synthase [Armatimonadota bacterium]